MLGFNSKWRITLANGQVSPAHLQWVKDGVLLPGELKDKKTGQVVKLGVDAFSLVLTHP